jgi:hypothetical protein
LASIVTLARVGDDLTHNVKLCTATAMLKVATRASRECAIIIFHLVRKKQFRNSLEWSPGRPRVQVEGRL